MAFFAAITAHLVGLSTVKTALESEQTREREKGLRLHEGPSAICCTTAVSTTALSTLSDIGVELGGGPAGLEGSATASGERLTTAAGGAALSLATTALGNSVLPRNAEDIFAMCPAECAARSGECMGHCTR